MTSFPPVHLLRHGQTDWNAARRMQGQAESDLTETGRAQARRQGEILATLGLADAEVDYYCSPLRRTRQTAALALPGAAGRLVFDDRLKEVFLGDWEGMYYGELTARWPETFASFANIFETCVGASGGEGFDSLHDRARRFLHDLEGPAVIVAHGAINMLMRGLLCGLERAEFGELSAEQGVVLEIRDGRETAHR